MPCFRSFWQKKSSAWPASETVHWVQSQLGVSERRSCAALRFDRGTHRYRSVRPDQSPLRQRIRDIAEVRVRYGYRRIHVLLRREGWLVNVERVRRLYRMEGLNLRARCLIPGFDGALFTVSWKGALWARYSTGAPQRLRQSVERYSIGSGLLWLPPVMQEGFGPVCQ